jgi:hypothetical protein
MSSKIEVLTVDIGGRLIGCMRDEITKVIPRVSGLKNKIRLKGYGEVSVIKLGELLKLKADPPYKSLLIMINDEGEKFFVAVPEVKDTVKLSTTWIDVVPDYIRRKQQPLVVWGFYNHDEQSIMLITFSYFTAQAIKEG